MDKPSDYESLIVGSNPTKDANAEVVELVDTLALEANVHCT